MTDLTTLGAAHEAGFADAVGREVVVQHEGVFKRALERIDQCRITQRAERCYNNRLSLATSKQRRAVRFR